jgi:hypothetical protein
MAYANIKTGEIVGAKEGTLTYYHEVGHLEYDKCYVGRIVRTIQDFSFRTLIFSMALFLISNIIYLKWFMLIVLLVNILSELGEEIDCWKYAKIQLNLMEVKNGREESS